MIGGVNFQPGGSDPTKAAPKGNQGSVQEAIKILSLRLPKVVGPRATAPAALLNAQGSGGNTRVDSVVNTVLQRYLPGGEGAGQAPPAAPMIPTGQGSSFSPGQEPSPTMPLSDLMQPQGPTAPRITPGDDQPRPPVIGDRPTTPGNREDVTPPSGLFPPNPDLPTYDREAGWGQPSEAVAPPAPTQDPWADLMEYLRRQPAPPQETYSI